jgi:hypothetical protein
VKGCHINKVWQSFGKFESRAFGGGLGGVRIKAILRIAQSNQQDLLRLVSGIAVRVYLTVVIVFIIIVNVILVIIIIMVAVVIMFIVVV